MPINHSPLINRKKPLAGIIVAFLAFTAAMAYWVLLMPVLVLISSLPFTPLFLRRLCQQIIGDLIEAYLRAFITALQIIFDTTFVNYGDVQFINKEENAIIMCNHPTNFDWMYLWAFLSKYSSLHRFKVILKRDVQFLPFIGYCIQIGMFLFLARDWAKDQSRFYNILDYYRDYSQYYTILIFPEGTNIGKHSISKAASFLEKNHMKDLSETLPPRTTGFNHLLLKMTGLSTILPETPTAEHLSDQDIVQYVDLFSNIDAIYNFTIAYGPSRDSREMNMPAGKIPSFVHVHLQRIEIVEAVRSILQIDVVNDPQYYLTQADNPYNSTDIAKTQRQLFEQKASIWLTNLFYQKDAFLNKYYQHVLQQAASSIPTSSSSSSSNGGSSNAAVASIQDKTQQLESPALAALSSVPLQQTPVLLDPTTYIPDPNPLFVYTGKDCVVTFIIWLTFFWSVLSVSKLRWFCILYAAISIVILTVKKFDLYDVPLSSAAAWIRENPTQAFVVPTLKLLKQYQAKNLTSSQPEICDQYMKSAPSSSHSDDVKVTSRQLRVFRGHQQAQNLATLCPQDPAPVSPALALVRTGVDIYANDNFTFTYGNVFALAISLGLWVLFG